MIYVKRYSKSKGTVLSSFGNTGSDTKKSMDLSKRERERRGGRRKAAHLEKKGRTRRIGQELQDPPPLAGIPYLTSEYSNMPANWHMDLFLRCDNFGLPRLAEIYCEGTICH